VTTATLAGLLLLAGCARPVGDFGRAEPDVIHDSILPAAGNLRAMTRGEPVSGFNKTDEEVEMADRIWRFMTSGRTEDWFYDIAAEWRRTRIWPGSIAFSIDRYYNWLHGTTYASAGVRYATLGADVGADLATIPSTFASICKVQTIDRQRQIAADHLPVLQDSQQNDMVARKAENAMQIDGFVHALRYRYDSYNFALDHLLVETPHPEAKPVDADLGALGSAVDQAERGDFCGTRDVFGSRRHNAPIIPPRIEHKPAQPANMALHAS